MKKRIAEIIGDLYTKRQYNKIIKGVNFGSVKKILDVGGSSGNLARKILRKFKDVDYTILDVKEESLIKGKKKNPGVKFVLGDAENMPFEDKSFDLVICKDVLHHCNNAKKVIREIKRVSNDYLIIEARRGDKWLDYYLPGHSHYTIQEFKKLVSPINFYFLDILWPRIKYMPLFLISPIIPPSKNAFMVATSIKK